MTSLCATCHDLKHERDDDDNSLTLKRHYVDFEASAVACRFCSALLQVLQFYDKAFHIAFGNQQIRLVIFRDGLCQIELPCVDGWDTIQLYSPPGEEPAWSGIYRAPEISPRPGSNLALRFIGECLFACTQGHDGCQQANTTFPTRLLYLGDDNPDIIRLTEPDKGAGGIYSALSYCWGTGTNLKATVSTLPMLQSGFSIAKLPQTIQDTIHLSRRLNINHLWVDALCIIQDSKEDWELESARMATVYQNAFITIAAASASTSDQGFLVSPTPYIATDTFILNMINEYGNSGILKARIQPSHYRRGITSPLDLRGWTLQESLLSTRLLSFNAQELRWTCNSRQTCECLIRHDLWSQNPSIPSIASLDKSPQKCYRYWHQVVGMYSGRMLTVAQDRLPAMSGLAATIQRATGSAYVAGLWADNLIVDLTWARLRLQDRETHWAPAEYVAPSFSWASVAGSIMFNAPYNPSRWEDWESDCQVCGVDMSVLGLNPFGRVARGRITLSGYLFQTILENAPDEADNTHFWWGPCQYRVHVHGQMVPFEPDTQIRRCLLPSSYRNQGDETICRAPAASMLGCIESSCSVWIFHLGRNYFTIRDGRGQGLILVLGKSSQGTGLYERLGILAVQYKKPEDWPILQDSPKSVINII